MSAKGKFVGRSVPRLEDRPLLTGQGRLQAIFRFPTVAYARRALAGRARAIENNDAKAALALPGVHAVWTHADIADIPPIGFRLTGLVELEAYGRRHLRSVRAICRRTGGGRFSPPIPMSLRTRRTW